MWLPWGVSPRVALNGENILTTTFEKDRALCLEGATLWFLRARKERAKGQTADAALLRMELYRHMAEPVIAYDELPAEPGEIEDYLCEMAARWVIHLRENVEDLRVLDFPSRRDLLSILDKYIGPYLALPGAEMARIGTHTAEIAMFREKLKEVTPPSPFERAA